MARVHTLSSPDVSSELQRWIGSGSDAIARAIQTHAVEAPGKRLRPRLVMAFAGEAHRRASVATASALVEMIHVGSLIHDDIIDEAVERRGRPTINTTLGTGSALLAGDLLLAQASAAAASLAPEVASWAAETVVEMCRAQGQEMASLRRLRSIDEYRLCIEGKTASLMSLSCRLGAWCRGATADELCRATLAGRAFGVAYQIADDILDLCGPPDELGRRPGADLAQGVMTLPIILAVEAAPRLLDDLPGDPHEAASRVAHAACRLGAISRARLATEASLASSLDAAQNQPGADDIGELARWVRERVAMAEETAAGEPCAPTRL